MNHIKLRASFVAILVFACVASAARIGGGDLNPSLETSERALRKWQNARVGFTVHWGPVAQRGEEIGWSRGEKIPKEEYDSLYKEFNPVLFNAREWVELIKNSGFRYVTFVSKHHDGFSMWASKQTDYNILNSPFGRDWLKEIAEECRRQGIVFGTYYSIMDWYHYDYSPHAHGGPGYSLSRPPDFDRYVQFMKSQLRELIEGYGSEVMLMDGNIDSTWTHERGADLYRFLRSVRDDIVISNRVEPYVAWISSEEPLVWESPLWVWHPKPYWNHEKYAGDYFEREQFVGGPVPYPWETWLALGGQWSWKPNDRYRLAEDCVRYLVLAAGGNGNFNLNVTPMPDGRFEQRQKDILLKMGAWLSANGKSIYETRGGPYEPGLWGASTQRDDKVYLHILSWPGETLRLPPLEPTVKSACRIDGSDVRWKQSDTALEISMAPNQRDPLDTVVELTLVK